MPTKDVSNKFVRAYNANKEDGGTANLELFNDAFRILYKKGKQGNDYKTVMNASGYVSNGSMSLRSASQAFYAGQEASKKTNAVVIGSKKYEKGVTVESKKQPSAIQEMQVRNLNTIAKKVGVSVVIADGFVDNNGFDGFNGAYKDNTVYINLSKTGDAINYVAGHELLHHIRANNADGYKTLEKVVVNALESNKNYNFDEEVQKMINLHWEIGNANFTKADAVEEIVAESCFDVLSNEKNINKIIEQDKTLAETIKDWLTNFIEKLKEVASQVGKNRAEHKALHNDIEALEKINDTFYSALLGTKKSDTNSDGEAKYSLGKYSEHEIENWKGSKSIVVFESEQQLLNFIDDAIDNKNLDKKMYFGKVPKELAKKVANETGLDINNFNCTLRASEIIKIFRNHGNEAKENLQGQRAITKEDVLNIPKVIQSPDKIKLSEKVYENKPVIQFIKNINGKVTVVSYVSKKHLDLTVQTMYAGKNKRNLATGADEQASANTPKATVGTVPNTNISQDNNGVNSYSMQKDEKDTNIKYMINEDFNKQYDEWDKKSSNVTFVVGETSDALQSIGVHYATIEWDSKKIMKIRNKHLGMSDSVIKQVPHILENPIVIVQSLQSDSRVTMFGDVLDERGNPVLAVLELTPTDLSGLVLDEIKIASAYGKNNAQSLINRSEILYVEPNKKRTNNWLSLNQLQLPSVITNYGSINRVSYNESPVNSYSMQNEKNNARFMLPSRDSNENDVQLYRN